jgi:hypothetical protein
MRPGSGSVDTTLVGSGVKSGWVGAGFAALPAACQGRTSFWIVAVFGAVAAGASTPG